MTGGGWAAARVQVVGWLRRSSALRVAKARTVAAGGPAGTDTMTGVGMSVGAPAYMAWEQCTADPSLDHRADLYAWGVVAHELLAGQRPFAGLAGAALMAAQITTMPPALHTAAPPTRCAPCARDSAT